MTDERIDLLGYIVCNMLTTLEMPAVDDDELDDLTLYTAYIGKL